MMEQFIKNISQKIFNTLGPGFSERVYHNAFEVELRLQGIQYETEKILPIKYEGHTVGNLRADLVIDGRTIVELKSAAKIRDEHRQQVANHIKLTGLTAGYIVNFPPVVAPIEVESVGSFVVASDLPGAPPPSPDNSLAATPPELFLPPWLREPLF
jgi:GxxExxY protein